MYKLKQDLRVSLDGCEVITIPQGKYETLPKVAVQHASSIKAFEGTTKGKEVDNSDWELPVTEEKTESSK
jgi:hypothetical protein